MELGAVIPTSYNTYDSSVKHIRTQRTNIVRYVLFMEGPKDRLRLARTNAGYETPSDAARANRNINKNTLISNENGNRDISRKMAQVYADAFGVSAGWLLYGNAPVEQRPTPLISWVSAGALGQGAQVEQFTDVPYVSGLDLDPSGDWIALRVDGRSMDKISPHDSIILVNRKDKALVPNACYVIGDGNGGASYKRFRPPNRFEPVSTKPERYSAIEFAAGNEPEIIGRVRRTLLSL